MGFVGRDRDLQCAINGAIINLSDWNIHHALLSTMKNKAHDGIEAKRSYSRTIISKNNRMPREKVAGIFAQSQKFEYRRVSIIDWDRLIIKGLLLAEFLVERIICLQIRLRIDRREECTNGTGCDESTVPTKRNIRFEIVESGNEARQREMWTGVESAKDEENNRNSHATPHDGD